MEKVWNRIYKKLEGISKTGSFKIYIIYMVLEEMNKHKHITNKEKEELYKNAKAEIKSL